MLTQQLAKNVFLSNERSIDRKIKEAFLAIWLEANLSKKGNPQPLSRPAPIWVEEPSALPQPRNSISARASPTSTWRKAAMLAGLFKAPAKYAPHVNLPAARARANDVLTNLVQSGLMTEGQVIAAERNPASVVDRAQIESRISSSIGPSMRCSGLPTRFPERSLIVRTTIDMGLQKAAENSIESSLIEYGERYHAKQGASVVIENGGAVRAMVGGSDYGESQFNRATKALTPTGLVLQDLHLFRGDGERHDADIDHHRRADYLGQLEPAQLRKPLRRQGHADASDRAVDQYRSSAAREGEIRDPADPRYGEGPRRRDADPQRQDHSDRHIRRSPFSTKRPPTPSSRRTACNRAAHGIAQIMGYDGKVLYDFNRDEPPAKRGALRKSQLVHEPDADADSGDRYRPQRLPSTTASSSAARPAPRRPIAMRGSSALPATTPAPSGSATTTIHPPTT